MADRQERTDDHKVIAQTSETSVKLATLDPRRWLRTARFAWKGLSYAYRTQPNFRMEVWITPLVLLVAAWLQVPLAQWCALLLCCLLVLSLELVNTALESVVDLLSPSYHPLAKVAKDTAAAAVLLAVVGAAVLGLRVFFVALQSVN